MRRAILLMLAQATALRPPASSLLANDVRDTAGDEAACVVVHSHCIADGPNRSASCDE